MLCALCMRTAMSWLLLVACESSTSLHGTTSCTNYVGDDIICGDGQLCIEGRALPDDGSIPPMCTDVSPDCPIHNCEGIDCPQCILRLCPYYPQGFAGTHLDGRTLRCT